MAKNLFIVNNQVCFAQDINEDIYPTLTNAHYVKLF